MPVAGDHSFVLMPSEVTGSTGDVGASPDAICGSILTLRACRCLGLCCEEHSGAYEGDREEKVPRHGLNS
jgi:hypothetical protein